MAGWCNGSAGMVHLWTLAGRLLDDAAARQLAVGAAWHAWEAGDGGESLCCGLAGRAYALLDLHRRGGGEEWLARARALAERAAAGALAGHGEPPPRGAPPGPPPPPRARSQPDSLYRGQLGVALLAADLENPRTAAMPLFGDEGWGEA
jgi:serine/threonine-protein kinase